MDFIYCTESGRFGGLAVPITVECDVLVLARGFEAHRGEIWDLFCKNKKGSTHC